MKLFKRSALTVLVAFISSFSTTAENYILYTSTDGKIVEPSTSFNQFGANIVTNTYEDDYGIIIFDGEVNEIGEEAFIFSSNLKTIEIPNSVTEIGFYAFAYCSNLKSIKIPNSVLSIGFNAFSECSNLKLAVLGTSIAKIENYLFNGCSSLSTVVIPPSVTEIGNGAFNGCSSLSTVVIPNSVTAIGETAFEECSRLPAITIPNAVVSIGKSAFRGCSALESFNGKFASEDKRCLIIDGVLNSFAPAGITSYVIPNDVTSIGDWVFSRCSGLTSVTIGNSVTEIGEESFYGCSNLSSVEIPNSVVAIGKSAFVGCSGLTSLVIGNSVSKIGSKVFSNCTRLYEITSLNTTPPSINSSCFEKVTTSTCTLNVPDEALEAYKAATGWREFESLFANDASVKGKTKIKFSGNFSKFIGYTVKKEWLYGEDPDVEPAFTPGAWDAAAMRFSDTEGKNFPTIPDDVYYSLKTLIFEITDISDDTNLRVMNGWWSAYYADNIHLKEETKDGLWRLKITEDIARDCARGGGGSGKDLNLMLTSGTATFHSVYYDDDTDEFFSVTGDVNKTEEYDIFHEKKLHLVGLAEDNDFYVILDGQLVPSELSYMYDAIVTLKPGSELIITNKQNSGINIVCTDSRDWKTYNLQGIEVNNSFKGIIIQNGKKMLRR